MEDMNRSIYLGFDPREAAAYAVARASAKRRLTQPIAIRGVVLGRLQELGLYRRPLEWREAPAGNLIMWDIISDAPMSTQHANARFLVPHLAVTGWALFMDGDVLVRGNLARIFDGLDPTKAVYCVKHAHMPPAGVKMDGQEQTRYVRKNWSSVVIWNCEHEANHALTVDVVNSLTGRDLHRFVWLEDERSASWIRNGIGWCGKALRSRIRRLSTSLKARLICRDTKMTPTPVNGGRNLPRGRRSWGSVTSSLPLAWPKARGHEARRSRSVTVSG